MKLILILALTTTASFAEFAAFDFSSAAGQEHLMIAQKADDWATEYLRNFLETIGTIKAGTPALLSGAVLIAQENLEKIAKHLTDNPDFQAQFVEEANFLLKHYAEELEGIFLAYPSQPKQAYEKAIEYLNGNE